MDGDMTPKANPANGHLTEGSSEQSGSHSPVADGHALKPSMSRRDDEEADDPEGWKKEAWGRELMLVEKMLDADSRNCEYALSVPGHSMRTKQTPVHAWDYRRYVLSSLPSTFRPPKTPETEIKYTTKKIESNFSNFSAWHQRTKELGKIWDALRRSEPSEDAGAEIKKMRLRGMDAEVHAIIKAECLLQNSNS